MQNFEKVFVKTFLFLIIVSFLALSIPVAYLIYAESHWTSRSDLYIRNTYKGKITTLFLSDSHGINAFIPEEYDKYVEGIAYNSCSSLCTLRGRYTLMMQEINRNPVETVILELSYETMSGASERVEGDSLVIQKLASWKDRIRYVLNVTELDDYPTAYYYLVHSAFCMFTDRMTYDIGKKTVEAMEYRGYNYAGSFDMDEYPHASLYRGKSGYISETINPMNEKYLRKIIEECQERNINIVLVTVPLPDVRMNYYKNLDYIDSYYNSIAGEYNINYYDMKKWSKETFDDKTDFADTDHMSYLGAYKLTNELGRLLQK